MSSAQAASRAKARRGAAQPTEPGRVTFGSTPTNTSPEISPNQLLMRHDYKLFVFEKKLKELHERTKDESNEKLNTINESMLSEALQSMDNRMDNLEDVLTNMDSTKNNTELNLKINKLENEQKELKTLLLKIQGTVMETQMQMMQIRNSGKPTTTTNLNEEVMIENMEGEVVNEEVGKKKGKRNN
jgi:hypothetical protein